MSQTISGNGQFPLESGAIPQGATCALMGFSQGAYQHNIKIQDRNGTVVAHITNPSGDASPTIMSNASTFTASSTQYYIDFGGGNNSKVLLSYQPATHGTKIYGGTWSFAMEDDDTIDQDYNDVIFYLSWTTYTN